MKKSIIWLILSMTIITACVGQTKQDVSSMSDTSAIESVPAMPNNKVSREQEVGMPPWLNWNMYLFSVMNGLFINPAVGAFVDWLGDMLSPDATSMALEQITKELAKIEKQLLSIQNQLAILEGELFHFEDIYINDSRIKATGNIYKLMNTTDNAWAEMNNMLGISLQKDGSLLYQSESYSDLLTYYEANPEQHGKNIYNFFTHDAKLPDLARLAQQLSDWAPPSIQHTNNLQLLLQVLADQTHPFNRDLPYDITAQVNSHNIFIYELGIKLGISLTKLSAIEAQALQVICKYPQDEHLNLLNFSEPNVFCGKTDQGVEAARTLAGYYTQYTDNVLKLLNLASIRPTNISEITPFKFLNLPLGSYITQCNIGNSEIHRNAGAFKNYDGTNLTVNCWPDNEKESFEVTLQHVENCIKEDIVLDQNKQLSCVIDKEISAVAPCSITTGDGTCVIDNRNDSSINYKTDQGPTLDTGNEADTSEWDGPTIRFALVYDGGDDEGNVVIYEKDNHKILWSFWDILPWSSCRAKDWSDWHWIDACVVDKVVLQNDGNFVFYGIKRQAIWSTNTAEAGVFHSYSLNLQKDGNVVLRDENSNVKFSFDTSAPEGYSPIIYGKQGNVCDVSPDGYRDGDYFFTEGFRLIAGQCIQVQTPDKTSTYRLSMEENVERTGGKLIEYKCLDNGIYCINRQEIWRAPSNGLNYVLVFNAGYDYDQKKSSYPQPSLSVRNNDGSYDFRAPYIYAGKFGRKDFPRKKAEFRFDPHNGNLRVGAPRKYILEEFWGNGIY